MASFNQIAADAWASLAAAASRAVSAVAAAPAWWWVAAATMVVVAQLTFWYVRWRRIHARLADVPGLAMGVLGALPLLFRNSKRLYDFDLEMHRKFGKTYKSTTGMWQDFGFVQTIDPVNIEYFLKTNFRNYVKPEDLRRRLLELIGDGIFRINHGYAGEYPMWHMQRKTIAKIFYKNNFDGFLQKVFIKHSNTLCDVVRKHANGGSGGNGDDGDGDVVDIQRLMYAFTLDSIADIGFGVPFNALTNPISVGAAFDQAQEMIFTRLFHPFFSVPVIGKLLYSDERLNERLITELDVFADNVITERRAQIAREQANGGGDDDDDDSAGSAKSKKKPRKRAPRGAAVGQDCLSLFLRNKDLASKLSNRQIRDIVMSLLLAGRDTTACTLSFAIAELLLNPDVLAKLHAEIDDKLAHTTLVGGDATVNADDLTQRNMPYLHGFIYEVLRLHPPVPIDAKQSVKDDVFPDGTPIPAKTTVAFSIYSSCRWPEFWPEPEVLKPERWDDASPTAFEFPVFQAGPRICLGLRMAVLESKINIVHVISQFDFSLAQPLSKPIPYNVRITTSIRGGLKVHVRERERKRHAVNDE